MGKQQQQEHQKQEEQIKQPKKIIKKVPFKMPSKSNKHGNDQELKDWKPMKISQTVEQQKQQLRREKVDLANNFLMALPKPKNEEPKELRLSFDEKSLFRPKQKVAKKQELTEEQIKWDVEDQTFIKKQFERENRQKIEHELVQEDEDEVVVEKIQWLNQKQPQIKEVDLTKVIDRSWNQERVKKNQLQRDIWDSSLLKGKGQISQFVRDAIKRFDDDEADLNKQHLNKKQMRSRYGW